MPCGFCLYYSVLLLTLLIMLCTGSVEINGDVTVSRFLIALFRSIEGKFRGGWQGRTLYSYPRGIGRGDFIFIFFGVLVNTRATPCSIKDQR